MLGALAALLLERIQLGADATCFSNFIPCGQRTVSIDSGPDCLPVCDRARAYGILVCQPSGLRRIVLMCCCCCCCFLLSEVHACAVHHHFTPPAFTILELRQPHLQTFAYINRPHTRFKLNTLLSLRLIQSDIYCLSPSITKPLTGSTCRSQDRHPQDGPQPAQLRQRLLQQPNPPSTTTSHPIRRHFSKHHAPALRDTHQQPLRRRDNLTTSSAYTTRQPLL